MLAKARARSRSLRGNSMTLAHISIRSGREARRFVPVLTHAERGQLLRRPMQRGQIQVDLAPLLDYFLNSQYCAVPAITARSPKRSSARRPLLIR